MAYPALWVEFEIQSFAQDERTHSSMRAKTKRETVMERGERDGSQRLAPRPDYTLHHLPPAGGCISTERVYVRTHASDFIPRSIDNPGRPTTRQQPQTKQQSSTAPSCCISLLIIHPLLARAQSRPRDAFHETRRALRFGLLIRNSLSRVSIIRNFW